MSKTYIVVLIAFFISQSLFAQTAPPEEPVSKMNETLPKNYIIKGKVIDADTNQPMEYANIALYASADSTIVSGMMTNAQGEFVIKRVPMGSFFLRANFIGYEKKTIAKIIVESNHAAIDLGPITLKPAAEQIGEVAVVADKARTEFKIDRRVVNVSQDINAIGGSAVEVLENTPSVQTDFDGNVTLRGSASFTVLIDGKPSILSGSDALRQIPATNIENIEIITNPSAKYDPDGVSGIINVVMKKNTKDAFSGLINLTTGTKDKYRGDMNFNFRSGKWNFLLGVDYSDYTANGSRKMDQLFFSDDNDTTKRRTNIGDGDRTRRGKSIKGGLDYQLTPKTSIGISGTIGDQSGVNKNLSYQHEYNYESSSDIYSFQDDSETRHSNFWSSDLNFQQKFNKKGHELQGLFFMSKKDGDEQEYQTTIYTNDQWEAIAESDSKYRTNEVSDESEYRVKLDYTLPISEESKFEAGYQAKLEKEDETYGFEEPGTDDLWKSNPLYESSFDYSHNLHSLYATFSHEGDGFSYQVGLRGEYADRKISSIQFEGTQRYEKFEFFPTLHFSQKLKHNLEFQASYSRRLERPDAHNLEPFASFIDQYNIRIGNPNLKPEFTNSYEITILKRLQKSFISVDGYYRTTNDLLTRSQSTGDDGIIYYSMDNINNDYSIGSEIMANLELKPGFRMIASSTLYNYRLKGEINGESIDQSSTNFDSRLNLDMKLAKNTRLQLTGIYSGSTVSAQGTRDPMIYSNAAIKQDFFDNSLTATLQLQDIFGTMKYGGTSYSDGYSNTYKYQRESQVLQLTLSYKINNFKNKLARGEDGSRDSGSMGEF